SGARRSAPVCHWSRRAAAMKGFKYSRYTEKFKQRRDSMSTKAEIPVETDFSSEIQEWIEAFDDMIVAEGPEQGAELLDALRKRARQAGVNPASELVTPYQNTIPKHEEDPYPGDRALEKRIEALIRWNAMAMVHGQNKK